MAIYTRSYSFPDGLPPTGGEVRSEFDSVANSTNNITNAQVSSTAAINQTKLDATTVHRSAMYVQSVTTNTLTSNQVIYHGWGYIGASGIGVVTQTVTLPNSGFDDANYSVSVIYTGEKATAPSGPGDVTSHNVNVSANIKGTTAYSATQFNINLTINNGGGNFNNNTVYTWIAIGTKA